MTRPDPSIRLASLACLAAAQMWCSMAAAQEPPPDPPLAAGGSGTAGELRPPLAPDPPPAPPADATPDPEDAPVASTNAELCRLIETSARAHSLPVDFFVRLLWKESNFRTDALSPKGAQGIAQFMPGTAAERGLDDPFDWQTAIPASAHLLADLKARFGNLGLAAAAYNAGAQRVSDWLADAASLPYETLDYVLAITGLPAETWSDGSETAMAADAEPEDCLKLVARLKVRPAGPAVATARGPWGVQVAGDFSRAKAVASYASMQKRFPSLMGKRAPMVISGGCAAGGRDRSTASGCRWIRVRRQTSSAPPCGREARTASSSRPEARAAQHRVSDAPASAEPRSRHAGGRRR